MSKAGKARETMENGSVPREVERLQIKSGIRNQAMLLDGTENEEVVRSCLAHAEAVNAQLRLDRSRTKRLWIIALAMLVSSVTAALLISGTHVTEVETPSLRVLEGTTQSDYDQLKETERELRTTLASQASARFELERQIRDLRTQLEAKDRQLRDVATRSESSAALVRERDRLRRDLESARRELTRQGGSESSSPSSTSAEAPEDEDDALFPR